MQKATISLVCLFLISLSMHSKLPLTSANSQAQVVPMPQPANLQAQNTHGSMPADLLQTFGQSYGQDTLEYAIEAHANGFHASNPAQGFTMDFSPGGIGLHNGEQDWQWSMIGYGYGTEQIALTAPTLQADQSTVTYDYGNIVEWYINSPLGLEQGFTIEQSLGANPAADKLTLTMQIAGQVTQVHDTTLRFGDHLTYSRLAVVDATGKILPATLKWDKPTLSILVDDYQAVYPLTVDPWIERQKLRNSDPTFVDEFGVSVAIEGDTALIGAHYNDNIKGAVYVFMRSAGVWTEQQKLTASDGNPNDMFGIRVALDGNIALIGACNDTYFSPHRQLAYIFVRSGGVWAEEQRLTDGMAYDDNLFGCSVDINGNTAIVGAGNDDNGKGSAYVFVRNGTTWSLQQKLIASDGATDDWFGFPGVSISGDTVLVGAIRANTARGSNTGAVYVFVRNGTIWSQQQKLPASDGITNDWFGYSVRLSGDATALVGSIHADTTRGSNSGAVYVFARSGTTWSQQQKIIASDGTANDYFGSRIASSGNTALVGAYGDNNENGSAYVLVQSGSTWSQQQKLTQQDTTAGDLFSWSVALDGTTALVGTVHDDNWNGAAYVFNLYFLPPAPTLISLPHRLHTTNNLPTFVWSQVNGADMYRLWVYSKDRSYLFKVRTFGETATSYTMTTPLSPNQYIWRVRDRNGISQLWSRWSPRFTLFVESSAMSPLRPLH